MTDVEARFLAAIAVDPDDRDARTVYADWLEERGDPRGEYLRLEAELHSIPKRLEELGPLIDPAWLDRIARRYDLIMTSVGPNKIGTILIVRQITGLGLKDAKDLVERASPHRPEVLKRDQERPDARRFFELFEGSGATVHLVPRGQPIMRP